ncbi:hypothetical protein C8Q77DRAFT_1078280 [Trametes polyzona]|nr:hypothetical protein C8Q77DRAFT_1078280 [Trametes polyzona]
MLNSRRRLALLATVTCFLVLMSVRWIFSDDPRLALQLNGGLSPFSGLDVQNVPYNQREQLALLDSDSSGAVWTEDTTFGVFSQVFVISRATRLDRRAMMERLRLALDVSWTYLDAISSEDPVVHTILGCVRAYRRNSRARTFEWPDLQDQDVHPPLSLSNIWMSSCFLSAKSTPVPSSSDMFDTSPGWPTTTVDHPSAPLTCALKNRIQGIAYKPSLPSYLVLTPAKIACWCSHLAAIAAVARFDSLVDRNGVTGTPQSKPTAFLILEDDVDMEQDVSAKLHSVWGSLPTDWEILYLGHCWSDESHHQALAQASGITLHPSFAPKCTHAYAINPVSALRLLRLLTHPPFAYSRAFDQALAWLIHNKRVKAFSVVPSLVIQHKASGSDIDKGNDGKGSVWRDTLKHGVLTP